MKRIRIRQYLVKKDTQFRYMALVAIPLVIALAGLYYLMYYSVLSQILLPEGVIAMLLPAMKKVNMFVAISLPLVLFIVLRLALVYSNRIVGPLPRITREIDKVLAGDHSQGLVVRDKDELSDFVKKINFLLEAIEKNRGIKYG
jgi:signal transduction histidine kinase